MDQKSGKPSQKRRAILQGSLAAPLVLTVSAAGAQTALSSAGRALQNLKNEQTAGLPKSRYFKNSQSEDNWFRQRVTVHQLRYAPNGITVSEEWYYPDPVSHKYYRISDMALMTFGEPLSSLETEAGWTKTAETNAYLLVWVDPSTGLPSPQMTAEPATGLIGATCSAIRSLNPAACPPTGNSV